MYQLSFSNASLTNMQNSQFLCMSTYIETEMYDMFICLCSAGCGGLDVCKQINLIMIDLFLYEIKMETIGSLDNGAI